LWELWANGISAELAGNASGPEQLINNYRDGYPVSGSSSRGLVLAQVEAAV